MQGFRICGWAGRAGLLVFVTVEFAKCWAYGVGQGHTEPPILLLSPTPRTWKPKPLIYLVLMIQALKPKP